MVDGDKFKIPKESYILAKNEIIFPNKITNLDVRKDSNIFLLFPNGQKATKFVEKEEPVLKNISFDLSEKVKEKSISEKITSYFKKKPSVKKKKKAVVLKKAELKNGIAGVKVRTDFAKQNPSSGNADFYNRNFTFIERKIEKKDTLNKVLKREKIELKKEKSFWLENIYFILFIILNFILISISSLLSYFEHMKKNKDGLNSEASEYEIEEI
jgi:hypothetical protein